MSQAKFSPATTKFLEVVIRHVQGIVKAAQEWLDAHKSTT